MAELTPNSIKTIANRLRKIPTRPGDQRPAVHTRPEVSFWARITAFNATTELYSWKRVIFDDAASDKFGDWPVTAEGTENAISIGGPLASLGDLVRLYLVGQDASGDLRFAFAVTRPTKFAKVVKAYKETGVGVTDEYTSFPVEKKLPYLCTANPANSVGGEVDATRTLYVKLNEVPLTAGNHPTHGVVVTTGDWIAYLPGDGKEAVPPGGDPPDHYIDGYVVPNVNDAKVQHGRYHIIPVTMAQVGGANGGPTSDATYTYSLTDPSTNPPTLLIAETEISTNTFGWWARTVGPVLVATRGEAFTDGTNWIVTWCNERPDSDNCPLT